MSEKLSEGRMAALALDPLKEIQGYARQLAGHGPVKVKFGRLARVLGVGLNRAKEFYYADPRCRVDPQELERARDAALSEGDELQAIEAAVARLELAVARLEARGAGRQAQRVRRAAGALRRSLGPDGEA